MSLLNWLKTAKPPATVGLPDPRQKKRTAEEAAVFQAANDAVDCEPPTKRRRGDYSTYTPEIRAQIARSAVDIGNTKAAKKWTQQLGRKINESTVRGFKKQYLAAKKKEQKEPTELQHKHRGAPLLLGEKYDKHVQNWIREVRLGGGVINARIVMAAAEGVLNRMDRKKLAKNGGPVTLTTDWAHSLLRRMGYVKRKGTKDVKRLPQDFDKLKSEYKDRVSTAMIENNIPDSLVLNLDQTGCALVPGGQWTMDKQGAKQITITGIDDKRQITVLLTVTMSGQLLPPQVIYKGTTTRCLPRGVEFDTDWNVTHSANHWSNGETMLEYIDKILVPYVEGQRELLSRPQQKALLVLDVFAAHRTKPFLEKLQSHGILTVFVPACCTDKLQPLDLSLNKEYKDELKACFHDWYAQQVQDCMEEREDETGEESNAGDVTIDLKMSTLKPVHARWLMHTHNKMEGRRDLVRLGFKLAGLSEN